jgi:hypothetical protein
MKTLDGRCNGTCVSADSLGPGALTTAARRRNIQEANLAKRVVFIAILPMPDY